MSVTLTAIIYAFQAEGYRFESCSPRQKYKERICEPVMDFSDALKNESRKTFTENGATALNSTGDACVDLCGSIGSLRSRSSTQIESMFIEAFQENKLAATKILVYSRDIRGGLGERRTFRILIKYLARNHPEAIIPNIDLIGVYGRYDDLYALVSTSLENDMWAVMKKQLEEDIANFNDGKVISLLAKWIKSPDASSKNTRKLGILTAQKMGYSVYDFKRILRKLRKHIEIVEAYMSAGRWDKIKYPEVPGRAMMIYKQAFRRHDNDRFSQYIQKALKGEAKINSKTLYPYDLVKSVLLHGSDDDTCEAQWRQLPNYVEPGTNAIVVADVSGSMFVNNRGPISSSIGLAIYFAERNIGAYRNLFMTFSSNPTVVRLQGETLAQKVRFMEGADWGGSTDLEAAFERVLEIALYNQVPPEQMVKSIIVISDMEIDVCISNHWDFYSHVKAKFESAGYKIPNVVFWNVNSRHDVFHADSNRPGVQICSGQSASTFKTLVNSIGMTPREMVISVISSERYDAVTIADKMR